VKVTVFIIPPIPVQYSFPPNLPNPSLFFEPHGVRSLASHPWYQELEPHTLLGTSSAPMSPLLLLVEM